MNMLTSSMSVVLNVACRHDFRNAIWTSRDRYNYFPYCFGRSLLTQVIFCWQNCATVLFTRILHYLNTAMLDFFLDIIHIGC